MLLEAFVRINLSEELNTIVMMSNSNTHDQERPRAEGDSVYLHYVPYRGLRKMDGDIQPGEQLK